MSDDHHDEEFQSAESGAAATYPKQCSALRKNEYVMIKSRPCKVFFFFFMSQNALVIFWIDSAHREIALRAENTVVKICVNVSTSLATTV